MNIFTKRCKVFFTRRRNDRGGFFHARQNKFIRAGKDTETQKVFHSVVARRIFFGHRMKRIDRILVFR